VGASGSVTEVLGDYLAGSLEVGESACDHADHQGHSCQHGK